MNEKPYEIGLLTSSLLQMWNLELKKVGSLVQGYTASKGQIGLKSRPV